MQDNKQKDLKKSIEEKKKKVFPCPICKGHGGAKEHVINYGMGMWDGPYNPCDYCDDKGMIEVGGKVHRRIKAESIALQIVNFIKPMKNEWTYLELQDLGNKALSLIG